MDKFENNFKTNNLQELGIHNLRILARECGVKSPTTLKKEELIDLILKIKNGEIKPSISNKGRKPKPTPSFSYDTNAFSEIVTNEYKVSSPSIEFDAPRIELEGQVKFINNSAPVIKFTEENGRIFNLPLSPAVLAKYNLKKDDVLLVRLIASTSYYNYTIEEIVTINGINASSYQHDKYDNLKNNFNEKYKLSINYNKYKKELFDTEILKGNSYFFEYSNNTPIDNFCLEICNNIYENNTYFVVLNGCTTKKYINNKANVFEFNINIEKSFEESNRKIILAEEKVKQLLTEGKSVVFIINSIENIFKTINYCIDDKIYEQIFRESIISTRKLINVSKFISETNNSTVLIFSDLKVEEKYKEIIKNDILKIVCECNFKD